MSGLERAGRAACTYPGSCDRTHSVFLLLFWWDMDLEKQKDWATDMYEALRVKSEPFLRESFSCHPPSPPAAHFSGLGVRRRQETVITAGGHKCTLRLILLLRFEVTRQDIRSIIHLTMRQIKQGAKKTKKKQAVMRLREKLWGFGSVDGGRIIR